MVLTANLEVVRYKIDRTFGNHGVRPALGLVAEHTAASGLHRRPTSVLLGVVSLLIEAAWGTRILLFDVATLTAHVATLAAHGRPLVSTLVAI